MKSIFWDEVAGYIFAALWVATVMAIIAVPVYLVIQIFP